MMNTQHSTIAAPGGFAPPSRRVLTIRSSLDAAEVVEHCGDEGYSYYFVAEAFRPLLERWANTQERGNRCGGSSERLEIARGAGKNTVQLSFLPLHHVRLLDDAVNVAFPFWEYPDIPSTNIGGEARNNWVRAAERLDLILTACEFTRQAFRRANVTTPIEVVPVPAPAAYFSAPPWRPGECVRLDCPVYLLPQARTLSRVGGLARKLAARAGIAARDRLPIPYAARDRLQLSGVVYSTVLNPFDERKNWREIISGFVHGLHDKSDAMFVVKLAASRSLSREALHNVLHFYQCLRMRHQCQVAITAAYLSDKQMTDLARGSTYYVNASRAEGACLPLAAALAAGRPALAPAHSALAEYIDESVAFVVPSRPRPTYWPIDPARRPSTVWHEITRDDLAEQFRISYEVARRDLPRYRSLAARGRRRMQALAGEESVWRRLSAALATIR